MLTQLPGSVYQIAYVVPSLEAAARQWSKLTGAGPFVVFDHFPFIDPIYQGRPTDLDVSIALGFSAGLCLEFIEQHDERSSIYHDWRTERGYGLHHVAMLVDDFPATLKAQEDRGAPPVFSAAFGDGTRMAYLDSRHAMSCYLELVEFTDFVRDALTGMRHDHDTWDGTDLLRPFAL